MARLGLFGLAALCAIAPPPGARAQPRGDIAAASPHAANAPQAQLLSHLKWQMDAPWFGGFSGAEINADGTRILLISDRGRLIDATLRRDKGIMTGVTLRRETPLRDPRGTPLTQNNRDAEGLIFDFATGQGFVSFEHGHRVTALAARSGQTRPLHGNEVFAGLPDNAGLEALAQDAAGRLLALPEHAPRGSSSFPVYVKGKGAWRIARRITRQGPFRPVGADVGPDGQLYVLERAVTLLGFRSRVRRFDLRHANRDTALPGTTLMQSPPGRFDNMEALAVWRGPDGLIRLTLISDDNFLSVQETQVVEFSLTE